MSNPQIDRLPSYLASPYYEEGMTGDDVLFFELDALLRSHRDPLSTHELWGVVDALRDHVAGRPIETPRLGATGELYAKLTAAADRFLADGSCNHFAARGVTLLLLDCELDATRQPLSSSRLEELPS